MSLLNLQPILSPRKGDAARKVLRDLALSLGAGNKLPTVREICRSLKISAVTAETVLSGLEEECVIIRRRGSGIYVSPRLYQRNIALVFGRNAFQPGPSTFCGMVVECSQRRASSHNESFSFYIDVPRDEASIASPVHADLEDALLKRRIDGVLLVARHSELQENWLRSQVVPVVSFNGGICPPLQPSAVGFDLHAMATLAASELIDRGVRRGDGLSIRLGRECTSVGGGKSKISHGADALVQALKDVGPNVNRAELGRQAMAVLCDVPPDEQPDGFIVMDDMLATGVIPVLQEQGKVIGRDVLVASHVNRRSPTLLDVRDEIIALEVDPDEIVETMFGMLETMMANKTKDAAGIAVSPGLKVGLNVGRLGASAGRSLV